MAEVVEMLAWAVPIGVGATLVLDLWAWSLRRFGVPTLDWALAGRWLGHFPRGRFMHDSIARAEPVRGERLLGWSLHYATGIAFAALLLAVCGIGWAQRPTLLPALTVGLLTVALPFFVMQPALGAGIASSKTPHPGRARMRSLATHAVFGFGLYLSALAVASVRGWL